MPAAEFDEWLEASERVAAEASGGR